MSKLKSMASTANVNGTQLYVQDTGGMGQPIVFSHGLLWNSDMFAPQVSALESRYRCVSYDHRGQGRSADGVGDEIDVPLLCADVVALIRSLNLGPVHFVGHSLGGFVGMRLGIEYPELVRSLVLCSTSAEAEPAKNMPKYKMLNFFARWFGAGTVVDRLMPIMHGHSVLNDPARAEDIRKWRAQTAANRRTIWRAANGVINRVSLVDQLDKIKAPTLVLSGAEDRARTPEEAKRLADAISGARLLVIPNAGHQLPVEQPQAVTKAISDFLAQA